MMITPRDIREREAEVLAAHEAAGYYKTADDNSKPPYYVLDMFPYPSGEGLHAGHGRIYTASDIFARTKRMQGFNVLHPTGWDAFGLPAEQFALKNKVHPSITTKKNTDTYRSQMRALGLSYDFTREVNTTDPSFYKWTQQAFLEMYKRGLAWESFEPINWCPTCKTGLANEDLENGLCERCSTPVVKRPMRQWVIDIKKYADRLLLGLDGLSKWPDHLKDAQRNWIGKSEGAFITFTTEDDQKIKVFTTRPDTLYGSTYLVLAPEHPLVHEWLQAATITNQEEVHAYVSHVATLSDIDRTALGKVKTGVKLGGVSAVNPADNSQIPVYIADYVLGSYGTGAIMAVPAHDERDFEFAQYFSIPIKQVIEGAGPLPIIDRGTLMNSDTFTGMQSVEASPGIVARVGGEMTTMYKLQDWVFSRQRYWGEPIPMVHDADGNAYPLAMSELPVLLPQVESYEPTGTGESPLAAIAEFMHVQGYINDAGEVVTEQSGAKLPEGKECISFTRESNTMPQWAGSSWYYLRFADPHNSEAIASSDADTRFSPVHCYVGGAEHSTRHLIYARYWHKFLHDIGVTHAEEPFERVELVGLVLGADGLKMSKRTGNVVNPTDVLTEWGVDVTRLYFAFMGNFYERTAWNPQAIMGLRRFVDKVLQLQSKVSKGNGADTEVIRHKTIQKVTEDIEAFKFNTAVSSLMVYVNELSGKDTVATTDCQTLLILLAPFAPVVSDLLYSERFGGSVHTAPWPTFDPSKTQEDTVTMSFTVNGKLRATFEVARDETDETVIETVKNLPQYEKAVAGATPKKIVVVKNKIVNVVV